MVKRRIAVYARLDALIELLGPAWYAVLGSNYGNAALRVPGPLRRSARGDPARPGAADQVPDRPVAWRLA